jgi:nucleotide-binding universal stress UspA family protein
MLPFRKVLFPVDYSEPCQAVVPYVKEMLRRFSAELTVVHAYGGEALAFSELPLTDPAVAEEARAGEERRLREFVQEAFPGQHVESIADLGEAGTVIHKIVQTQGTDLVMLATHGRGPVRRFLVGSVAAKVLHDVGAAVWTGTSSYLTEHAPRLPYRSLLCALDDREEAVAVLKGAAALAAAYHASLSVVHVIETPPMAMEIDYASYRTEVVGAADFRIRELKGELGIDAPHAILDGPVAGRVREEALRKKADLVVLGRGRAQATFSRLWSHVYPIVREAPCPVLSI